MCDKNDRLKLLIVSPIIKVLFIINTNSIISCYTEITMSTKVLCIVIYMLNNDNKIICYSCMYMSFSEMLFICST